MLRLCPRVHAPRGCRRPSIGGSYSAPSRLISYRSNLLGRRRYATAMGCRGRHPEKPVRRHPAADRGTAAAASIRTDLKRHLHFWRLKPRLHFGVLSQNWDYGCRRGARGSLVETARSDANPCGRPCDPSGRNHGVTDKNSQRCRLATGDQPGLCLERS